MKRHADIGLFSDLSDIETEIDDIPVTDPVSLALQPDRALFACLGIGSGLHEVVVSQHLGADKPLFNVRMDHLGRVYGLGIPADGPGPDFVFTDGKNEISPIRS
jgi:hypothetical protein